MEPRVFYARTTDDVTIACGVVGSGPTLVLLPGVPFSNFIEEWQIPLLRRVYERLATRLQIVQYDGRGTRSEEHTSELQSHHDLVCRLLLEKKKKKKKKNK